MPLMDGWFKSSYSAAASDNCVEVRFAVEGVGVRDSKHRSAGAHWVSGGTWQTFVGAVKRDRIRGTSH